MIAPSGLEVSLVAFLPHPAISHNPLNII